MLALCALATAPLSISTYLAWQGLWPVLPFAGAEVLALWVAFHVCARRGATVEVVTVDADAVSIGKGREYPADIWSMPRAWINVSLKAPRHVNHPSRLTLSSHGVSVELGGFLTEQERTNLSQQLREVLRCY